MISAMDERKQGTARTDFRHKKIMISLVILNLGSWFPSFAGAEEHKIAAWLHEMKFGVLHHDTPGLWSNFRRESGIDLNMEMIFSPHVQFLGGTIRPALGGSINTVGDTSKAYTGLRWQYDHSSGFFAGIGLGGAIHDGKLHLHDSDRKALGSRILFHIPIELGYRMTPHSSLSVFFDHVSNAFLADHNEGMDTLGGRLGYRF